MAFPEEFGLQRTGMDPKQRKYLDLDGYSSIIANAADGFLLVDLDGRILEANNSYCQLIGHSCEEILDKHISEIDPIADARDVAKRSQEIIQAGSLRFEAKHQHRDGRAIDVEVSSSYSQLYGGIFFSFIRDITDKRSAEQAIRQSEQKFATVFNASPEAISITSLADGRYIEVNDKFLEITGLHKAEVIGRTSVEFGFWLDLREREQFFTLLSVNGALKNYESRFRIHNGELRDFLVSCEIIEIDGEQCCLSVLMDITERKQMEDAHKKSVFFFKESQRAAFIGSYFADFVSGRWDSSEVMDTIFGIGPDYDRSIEGWLNIVHPDDQELVRKHLWEDVIANRNAFSKEYRIVRNNDGETRWMYGLGAAEFADNGSIRSLIGTIQDISERKEAEEKLRKSDERNRLFFESHLVGMAISLPGKQWQQANDKLCQMLGYSREELMTKTWPELTHPDDVALELENFELLLSGALDSYSIEKRIVRKNGEIVPTNLSVGCLRHADGSVDYLLAILEDITAQQLVGLKREEDRRFLQTILDSISDFIFYKDKNGIFLGCNEAYATRYIGMPKDLIIGHPDKDFNSDEELVRKYVESDRKVMESGRPVLLKPLITLANGQKALIEVLKAPLFNAQGEVNGVIGVARDMTEHHLALEAITREKETAQRYLDIAGVMFCALNRAGEIILINRKGSEILGYADNELLGQNWFDVCLPEEVRARVKEVFALQLAGELAPVEFYENSVINQKGEKRLIAFHNTLLRDEAGISGVLFSGEDITDKSLMQNELLKNQKLESLGVLAGGIAHDFNNILTGIVGNISLARMNIDNAGKAGQLLENAEKASLRASSLATQLLTFAKGGTPIKKRVSVVPIVEEAMSLALRGANVKGIVTAPESIHVIDADEGQLSQVFNNLIINAVQAMPGGGTLTVTAENYSLKDTNEYLLPQGEYIMLSFSDQGCGIPEEEQKKIFDPYFTTKSGGNGLGLASANSILIRHGGHIGVKSVIGQGTTFTILLPSIAETFSKCQAATGSLTTEDHGGGTILVMDDERMILDIATDMLEHLGYRAVTCENGAEAVAAYKDGQTLGAPFAAVIMDLTIPGGMGGKEAAVQILAIDPQARLVVSSGYSNDPIMANYGSHGFAGAVTKPYTVAQLSYLLSSVVPVTK
jgi:PAS domain S-box-containing protein